MADILHKLTVAAAPTKVYATLTEQQGLAGWWTENVHAEARSGAVCRFRFDGETGPDMEILDLRPNELVHWRCVAHSGDPRHEWINTELFFALETEAAGTILRFSHRRWLEGSDYLRYCSLKWATYLLGLKRLLEGGQGTPWPRDWRI